MIMAKTMKAASSSSQSYRTLPSREAVLASARREADTWPEWKKKASMSGMKIEYKPTK